MDTQCPWCGEELSDPFDGGAVKTPQRYDRALEAHVGECADYLAENGEEAEV